MTTTYAGTLSTLGQAAVAYATEVGWRVHPCRPNGKEPLTKSWTRDASNNPDVVAAMWKRWPNANIAVCCGPDSIDVLDIDEKGAAQGRTLAERAWRHGLLAGWTASVQTPSGGTHLWFPGTDQGGGAIGKHRDLELKSAGGYVLLPPSHVVKPGEYEGVYDVTTYREDGGHPIDWAAVRNLLAPPKPIQINRRRPEGPTNFDGLVRHVTDECVVSGNCNAALFWASCRAVEGGAGADVFDALLDAAVKGGHPEAGARATIRSAHRKANRSAA